ncbi:hypothetical protein CPC197_0744, partial [Chlamydia psittaci C1/97]
SIALFISFFEFLFILHLNAMDFVRDVHFLEKNSLLYQLPYRNSAAGDLSLLV